MKKITQLFVTFAFAFIAAFSVTTIVPNIVTPQAEVVQAATVFGEKSINSVSTDAEANKITKAIFKAANIFSGFVLGISIIMIIVGGLRYILANGDQRQAEQGKMILIYSGIGIVIALSAFVIARLFAGLKF